MGATMGRKPMGMKEYKVQLDPKTIEEVDARVGTYRRSTFIREAVAEKLAREGTDGEQSAVTRTKLGQGAK